MSEDSSSGMSREMEMGLAQMEQIKSAVGSLNMQKESLEAVIDDYKKAVDVLQKLKEGARSDIMLPIGGLVYIRARLDQDARPIVDQGMGVMMEMEIGPSLERIEERSKRVQDSMGTIEERIKELMERYDDISEQTQKMYQDQMGSAEGPEKTF